MILEQQVCTLEQAKKLKEIMGKESIFANALFFWNRGTVDDDYMLDFNDNCRIGNEYINAYTSVELGEVIIEKFGNFEYVYVFGRHRFLSTLSLEWKEYLSIPEAHARAEFLIYLLENRNDEE